jgi:hypothetical protein
LHQGACLHRKPATCTPDKQVDTDDAPSMYSDKHSPQSYNHPSESYVLGSALNVIGLSGLAVVIVMGPAETSSSSFAWEVTMTARA